METLSVKELIEKLKKFDGNLPVVIGPWHTDIQEGVKESNGYILIS